MFTKIHLKISNHLMKLYSIYQIKKTIIKTLQSFMEKTAWVNLTLF